MKFVQNKVHLIYCYLNIHIYNLFKLILFVNLPHLIDIICTKINISYKCGKFPNIINPKQFHITNPDLLSHNKSYYTH